MKRRDRRNQLRGNQPVWPRPDREALLRSVADSTGPDEDIVLANPDGVTGSLALAVGRDVQALQARLEPISNDVNALRDEMAKLRETIAQEAGERNYAAFQGQRSLWARARRAWRILIGTGH